MVLHQSHTYPIFYYNLNEYQKLQKKIVLKRLAISDSISQILLFLYFWDLYLFEGVGVMMPAS